MAACLALLCCLLVMQAVAGSAWGQPVQPLQPALPEQPSKCPQDDAQPLDAALSRLPDCQNNASWLAWAGDRLNRQGRTLEALDYLERALLVEPGLLPAQLGYVLALAANSETSAALALAQSVLESGQLPAGTAQSLSQRVRQWRSQEHARAVAGPWAASKQPTDRWIVRLSAGSRVGYDSNLLGAPNLESLTLLVSGQPVQLPLDPSYLSQGGSYLRLEAQAEASRLISLAGGGVIGRVWPRIGFLSGPPSGCCHPVATTGQC